MKNPLSLLLPLLLLAAVSTPALAADLARGRALFRDPGLGRGTSGKSCATCHEGGMDIGRGFAGRERYSVMGIEMTSLAEVIDFCIEVALRGEGLDPAGDDYVDLVAYLKTIAGKRQNPHR